MTFPGPEGRMSETVLPVNGASRDPHCSPSQTTGGALGFDVSLKRFLKFPSNPWGDQGWHIPLGRVTQDWTWTRISPDCPFLLFEVLTHLTPTLSCLSMCAQMSEGTQTWG